MIATADARISPRTVLKRYAQSIPRRTRPNEMSSRIRFSHALDLENKGLVILDRRALRLTVLHCQLACNSGNRRSLPLKRRLQNRDLRNAHRTWNRNSPSSRTPPGSHPDRQSSHRRHHRSWTQTLLRQKAFERQLPRLRKLPQA